MRLVAGLFNAIGWLIASEVGSRVIQCYRMAYSLVRLVGVINAIGWLIA